MGKRSPIFPNFHPLNSFTPLCFVFKWVYECTAGTLVCALFVVLSSRHFRVGICGACKICTAVHVHFFVYKCLRNGRNASNLLKYYFLTYSKTFCNLVKSRRTLITCFAHHRYDIFPASLPNLSGGRPCHQTDALPTRQSGRSPAGVGPLKFADNEIGLLQRQGKKKRKNKLRIYPGTQVENGGESPSSNSSVLSRGGR